MRGLVRIAAFPVIWGAAVIGAWLLLGVGVDPLVVAFAAGTWTLTLVTLLEVTMPFRREWRPRWRDLRVDATCFAVGVYGIGGLRMYVTPIVVAAATSVGELAPLPAWPASLPFGVQVLCAMLVSQLVGYGWHRLHHAVPVLWRFHAFHHSADRMYWLNAARNHPIEELGGQLLGAFAILLVGAPADVVLISSIAFASFSPFQHTNADLAWGPLEWVLSTNRVHRFHHSARPDEANHNYGNCMLVWDHVFRTFRRFRADAPDQLGTGGRAPFPETYVGQLVAPVTWRREYEVPRSSRLREVRE